MTKHHTAALAIAALMVIGCVWRDPNSLNSVVTLATAIVAGTFGHAGRAMGPPA